MGSIVIRPLAERPERDVLPLLEESEREGFRFVCRQRTTSPRGALLTPSGKRPSLAFRTLPDTN